MEKVDFETFCSDPQLVNEGISKPWADFYRAVEGLPLDVDGVDTFRLCTGRADYEPRRYTEATGICGRRSEKTSTALKFLLWKILFGGWETQMRRSWFARLGRHAELLRVPIVAQDLRIAAGLQRTLESLVLASPVLSKEVAEVLKTEIVFNNGLSTICVPASKASTRGMTCPAALLDELAWVSIEGADDKELVRQVRPSMIQFGESRRLIKLSTPWQRRGVLYDEFCQRDSRSDLLVWQASTALMTPRIDWETLEREREADPTGFTREYEAVFTSDLEAFLPGADIDAAIADWNELPPAAELCYVAALDASGLTGGDRFAFGIAHSEAGSSIVDVLRGWRRASVAAVCDEIASICEQFRIQRVTADQYSFSFLAELLRQREITLEQLTFSARSKPELFFDLKAALAQGQLSLPNHPEAVRELRALESVRTSGGNYRISAPKNLHDDYAVTLALLAHQMKRGALHAPIICVLALDGSDEAARAERTEKDLRSREREERFFRRGFRLS